jgi:hypothetical protein
MMAHCGLESFSNMLEPQCSCVDKMEYVSVGHLLPLDFHLSMWQLRMLFTVHNSS